MRRFWWCSLVIAMLMPVAAAAQAPGGSRSDDPLSLFGQDISAAVDRAADLSIYATLCGVGREAAAFQLRDVAARKLAACFKADSKAATWSADLARQFDGKRALLQDLARMRSKDAVCSRLFESDGKTLSAFGQAVAADGERYAASAATAPIAGRPCP
ncbi:MAG TPA: hypothetical protein VJ890_19015 [Vineibacter sp.]|nr:hypothetical protein [Vineibacter sp.]